MDERLPRAGSRSIAVLALLVGTSWPAIAVDRPDTPPPGSRTSADLHATELPVVAQPAAGLLAAVGLPASGLPASRLPTAGLLAAVLPTADLRTGEPGAIDAEELLVTAQRDPVALGPLSIGTPDAGLLLNPVPFPAGPFWTVRDPEESWATDETIGFIVTAIEAVEARYPGSPRLVVGDLSNPRGGRLNRHRSHQTGRDADIGFYYRRGEVDSFLAARKKDLDLPRTWAFVRALITETDVDRIFVDRHIISALFQHAVTEGEDRVWLDDVFGRRAGEKGIIQHERRHKDHLHARFFNPRAQEHGRITYPVLVESGTAPPPMVRHRVLRGDTLSSLARRYGTSASAIRAANGLRGSRIRAGRSYTIPIRRVPPESEPVVVPPRRLPPELAARTVAGGSPEAGGADASAAEQR